MSEENEENKEQELPKELSGNTSTVKRKKALLEMLEKNLGIVTKSCEGLDIGRTTYYDWINDDPFFKSLVEDLSNVALDFAESQLHLQMKDGNASSTIFYLKCKGRKRGYIERSAIDHTTLGDKIQPNILHLGVGTKPKEDGKEE